MALQIDDDWKKQAQEEKRRLAEEAKAREAAAKPAAAAAPAAAAPADSGRRARALPAADFGTLVSTLLTQASYSLGEYGGADGEPMVDLDGAKLQLDLLAVIEEKTKGNLTPIEQGTLDSALYELRSRWVSVATATIR